MSRAVLAGLFVLLLPSGPAAADLAEIRKAGVLRVVAVEVNSPMPGKSPFLEVEKDAASGLDADVLGGFARSQGLGLAIVRVGSWERLVSALLEGKGDVIAGNVAATDSRRAQVEFSVETLPTRALLLSYAPNGPFTALEQIAAEKVAVLKDTVAVEALLAAGVPRASLVDVPGPQALLDALREGRVRVAALDLIAALEAQRRDEKFQLGAYVGPAVRLGFGLRKDCPRLLAALDLHINALKSSPSWYRLLLSSFGASAPDVLSRLKAEKR